MYKFMYEPKCIATPCMAVDNFHQQGVYVYMYMYAVGMPHSESTNTRIYLCNQFSL